ncbi:unnamed protein product [Timema podura]|uniref:DUF4485 domain-containing protein n=1 Tax=Timema podura TaxID=61482 RepID=A0ABN7P5N6_TIMPD|nr:unnamed protein product [Timema podura]
MTTQVEKLNRNFNHNMILAKTMVGNLRTSKERHLVYQWVEKLKGCSYSTDEMRLRNDFMFYLVTNLQSGELRSPFRRVPPKGPLARALVGHYDDGDDILSDETEFMSSSDTDSHRKPLPRLPRPPASGKFLVPQPMPACGAFCYLSVLSKGDNVTS